jgi:hypothetical protein
MQSTQNLCGNGSSLFYAAESEIISQRPPREFFVHGIALTPDVDPYLQDFFSASRIDWATSSRVGVAISGQMGKLKTSLANCWLTG